MNVGTATVSAQSQQQTSKQTSDSSANRGTFLDMLTAATSDTEIAIEPLNIGSAKQQVTQLTEGLTDDIFSKLLTNLQGKDVLVENDQPRINLFTPNERVNEENLQALEEIKKLLDLLPDYLRAEVEQTLKSGESLNFQEADQTLAQMLALFMSIASTRTMERDALLQNLLERLRNQLQQALKAESQLTGLNSNEILTKLDTLMSSTNNQSKQDYLQGLLHRISLSGRQSEQTGLNVSAITDPSQNMSKTQQLVIHIGEQPTKEAEQKQFIRQFQDILGRGVLKQLNNGITQLTIKLNPQHLGRLDIQVVQMQGVITAKITATTAAARELIEGQLQQLRNAFAQQQINVERVEVHQQQSQNQLNKEGQNRQQQGQSDKDDQNPDERSTNENSFDELLNEITFNEKV